MPDKKRLELAVQFLSGVVPVLYPIGCEIDFDEFSELARYKPNDVSKLFEVFDGTRHTRYSVEWKCDCGEISKEELNKSKAMVAMRMLRVEAGNKGERIECLKCRNKRREERLTSEIEWKASAAKTMADNTADCIESMLSSDRRWVGPQRDWWKSLCARLHYTNEGEISDYIKAMSYSDFLKTPYWAAISNRVKWKAEFRCQMCNSEGELHVHHRTYGNHGSEHDNLQDLICVCADCHHLHHFKSNESF